MTPERKARFFQIILEAILPIVGYFYWNWDTSFILLFYFLEWTLFLAITSAKGRKRYYYLGDPNEKKEALRNVSLGFVWLFLSCIIFGFTLIHLEINLSWLERIHAFITYSDMGIAQGYLLIPILILNGVMVYKQQFISVGRYKTLSMKEITAGAHVQGLIVLVFATLSLVVSFAVIYPSEIILFGTIIGTSIYKMSRN